MLVHIIADDRLDGGFLLFFAQRREFVAIQFDLRFPDSLVIPQNLNLQLQDGSSPLRFLVNLIQVSSLMFLCSYYGPFVPRLQSCRLLPASRFLSDTLATLAIPASPLALPDPRLHIPPLLPASRPHRSSVHLSQAIGQATSPRHPNRKHYLVPSVYVLLFVYRRPPGCNPHPIIHTTSPRHPNGKHCAVHPVNVILSSVGVIKAAYSRTYISEIEVWPYGELYVSESDKDRLRPRNR